MVARMLDRLFGCRHRRVTRPITPARKRGVKGGVTYVACLDCGRYFHYDVQQMRMGNPISLNEAMQPSTEEPFQTQY
jgi:ribosomal protein S26